VIVHETNGNRENSSLASTEMLCDESLHLLASFCGLVPAERCCLAGRQCTLAKGQDSDHRPTDVYVPAVALAAATENRRDPLGY
jgi:hypothetical protein